MSARVLIDSSPKKVAAGQADGITPRTIEVLQVHVALHIVYHVSNLCNRATDSPNA